MPDQIRILIVDDSPHARQSLRALLSSYAEDTKLDEASDSLEALQFIQESPPHIVFMDIRMPGLDGITATRLIKRDAPRVKVIAWSVACDLQTEALTAGADAFVCKGDPPGALLDTFARVAGLSHPGD